MTPWYTIRNHADVADVAITGPIEAPDARRFIAALPSNARTINLRISSLGGDPIAAMQIAAALRAHRARVEVTIAKIAASAATLPAMAGDRVRIAADAAVMIHAPRMIPDNAAPLTVRRLRAAAGELEGVRNQMATVYGWRLKGGNAAIGKLVDDEGGTWFDPAEAVRLGLADEVTPSASATAARFDSTAIASLGPPPARFAAFVASLGGSAPRAPRAALPEARSPECADACTKDPECTNACRALELACPPAGAPTARAIYGARNQPRPQAQPAGRVR